MAVKILSRSRWTSTAARGTPFTWSRVRGIVCHYPAAGRDIGVLTEAQEQAQIRRWRNYHVGHLGWVDLGYNYVITQAGRIYTGRGDRVGAHAVGHNSRTVGVLFVVGDNEPLTAAAKAAFKALRNTLRRRGCGAGVWGHRQMSGNSTRCPGPYIMADIRDGSLKGGTGGAQPAPARAPWDASPRIAGMSRDEVKGVQRMLDRLGYDLGSYGVDGSYGRDTWEAVRAFQRKAGLSVDGVAGPATMVALKSAQPKVPAGGASAPAAGKPAKLKAPAFPLPRRKGALCYYGPPDGPRTSVSGRGRNTLAPGDVVQGSNGRWYSKGLKQWQARMKARGYSITVDGRFGAETERIVRYFQQLVGLTADGKIGPATWSAAWTEPVR